MRWVSSVFASAVLFSTAAAADDDVSFSKDGRSPYLPPAFSMTSTIQEAPSPAHDRTLKTIFGNIDTKFPNAAYWCCGGFIAMGPNAEGATQTLWPAVQFSPSKDATATEIDLAVSLVSGTNTVTVGLYTDSAGVPGALLASFKPKLLDFHTCCRILVGELAAGVPLKQGTPYWIALTTDSTQSDTSAEWNFNMTDQVNGLVIAGGDGNRWLNDGPYALPPAFAIYGP
jgi:hypothetical protein